MSDDVIFHYTRRMAIADGALIDATEGQFAAVSREHFPDHHLAMTSAVFTLIAAGVNVGGDFAGLWHDALWMARMARVRLLPNGHTFQVGIRTSTHLHRHELKILFHGGDNGEPCATVMLPDED